AVTVDGVSKPGIYFANGTEYARCIGCVVRNVSGPLGDQPGFYISGNTNIELVGCESYSNQGHGVQVSTDGFPSPDGTGTRHVRIVGGAFHNNGANGLNVGHLSNKRVEDLLVTGGSYYANGNHGINIASGERVVIDAVQAYENDVAGVMLDNNSGALTRSTVQNSHIYNNNVTSSYGGIVMRGTHYARAVDNWLYNDQDTKTQDYGFLFIVGTGDVANRHLYIEGNQIGDHALATFGGQTSATIDETTGYISAWRAGSPQNINWHFPLRSLVLDTTTGREWVKEVTGTAGWRRRTAQSMGTQTVNMAETAIAHGLGYAPGMVTVPPFANQTGWQTRAADATNVYLSASADGTTVRIQVK
ncbi:MAG: right-handed parallel beta-helix repeat-containing protein, partial [Bacteroidota bacterium]